MAIYGKGIKGATRTRKSLATFWLWLRISDLWLTGHWFRRYDMSLLRADGLKPQKKFRWEAQWMLPSIALDIADIFATAFELDLLAPCLWWHVEFVGTYEGPAVGRRPPTSEWMSESAEEPICHAASLPIFLCTKITKFKILSHSGFFEIPSFEHFPAFSECRFRLWAVRWWRLRGGPTFWK